MKSPPFRYPYDTVAGAASSMDRPPKKWRNGPNHGKIKKSGGPCARIAERQTMTTTPKHPHNGHRARLRQRARETGLAGLADHEVLELLLTYAIPRVDTNRTAHRLIHTFGSLSGVLEARYEDLRQVEGVGENAATLLTLFPSLTRRYLLSRTGEKPLLNTSERAGEFGRAGGAFGYMLPRQERLAGYMVFARAGMLKLDQIWVGAFQWVKLPFF